MTAPAQLTDDYHLSLSIGKGLWDDLVGAALPLKVRDGTFDLGRVVVSGMKQIGVRQRVRGLLEDRTPPATLVKAKDRAAQFWADHREEGRKGSQSGFEHRFAEPLTAKKAACGAGELPIRAASD